MNEEKQKYYQEIKTSFKELQSFKGDLNFDYVVFLYKSLKDVLDDQDFVDYRSEIEEMLEFLVPYRFKYKDSDDFYKFFLDGVEQLLSKGIDANYIIEGIKYFNYQNWDLESYRLSREMILGNLYKNKNNLTKTNIFYESGKEEEGSIKNWFKHYQTYFDHQKDLRLGLLEYLDINKSVSRLTTDEKIALKNLIYVVEYLRAPAEETLLNEETNFFSIDENTYGLIEDGELTIFDKKDMDDQYHKFVPSKKSTQTTENKIFSLTGLPVEQPVINNVSGVLDYKQLVQLSENDLLQLKFVTQKYKSLNNEEVVNYFWEGYESYNLEMVLGAVQELITRQQWDDFVTLPRLKLLLKDFNSRRQLFQNTDDPRARLRLFFEWLLEEHLGLTDDKTKKWALYFNNLLLKNNYLQYKNLLAFDKQTQKLKWFET